MRDKAVPIQGTVPRSPAKAIAPGGAKRAATPTTTPELARETLRRLLAMGKSPNPENYARAYAKLAGLSYAQVQPAAAAIETLVQSLVGDAPEAPWARELQAALRETRWEDLQTLLRGVLGGEHAAVAPAPESHLAQDLHQLVRLMVRNMGDLVVDDSWVKAQTAKMQTQLAQPLSPEVLEQTRHDYREFVYRQGTVKHAMDEAIGAVQAHTADLIDRVGEVSAWTGAFANRLGDYAEQVREADDMPRVGDLLQALLAEMQAMQLKVSEVHRELDASGRRIVQLEASMLALQADTGSVDEMLPRDPLTRSLSPAGFERLLGFELGRAQRETTPTTLALLDVGQFHRHRLGLGHTAQQADEALRELAQITRESLRAADSIARWEPTIFALLMPDTTPDDGERLMVRLQRELTKRFFLTSQDRLLVTFSAGVAAQRPGESAADLLARAQAAMNEAARSGRNRVARAREDHAG